MQPYLFPYLGYFQLLQSSDIFVFYDDVNFIKNGWINRNRVLNQGKPLYLTIPVNNASSNIKINEVKSTVDPKWSEKIDKQITQLYGKAPYYSEVRPVVMSVLSSGDQYISEMASRSIQAICSYLDYPKEFKTSSVSFPDTIGMDRADRLIDICKRLDCSMYVNLAGGRELYQKEYFSRNGVDLSFVDSSLPEYKQFNHPFVSGLSIIDVLMFNDKKTVLELFKDYRLT